MTFLLALVCIAVAIGGLIAFVACCIALGPFFWVLPLLVWLWLRAAGATPKQYRKTVEEMSKNPPKWALVLFGPTQEDVRKADDAPPANHHELD